jgi:hypothetical protein
VQHRKQQVVQAGEWHLRLKRRTGGAEDLHAQLARPGPGLVEQRRLAYPDLAPDQQRLTTSAHPFEQLADHGELALPPKQLRQPGQRRKLALTGRQRHWQPPQS